MDGCICLNVHLFCLPQNNTIFVIINQVQLSESEPVKRHRIWWQRWRWGKSIFEKRIFPTIAMKNSHYFFQSSGKHTFILIIANMFLIFLSSSLFSPPSNSLTHSRARVVGHGDEVDQWSRWLLKTINANQQVNVKYTSISHVPAFVYGLLSRSVPVASIFWWKVDGGIAHFFSCRMIVHVYYATVHQQWSMLILELSDVQKIINILFSQRAAVKLL